MDPPAGAIISEACEVLLLRRYRNFYFEWMDTFAKQTNKPKNLIWISGSKVFMKCIQVNNSRCRKTPPTQDLSLSGTMWVGLHNLQRLQQCQVRLIKVWKVCSSYLWDGSVPGDVNTAHHTPLCPPRTPRPYLPQPFTPLLNLKPRWTQRRHRKHGHTTPATGKRKHGFYWSECFITAENFGILIKYLFSLVSYQYLLFLLNFTNM